MKRFIFFLMISGIFALTGCSAFQGDDAPLEGERISVLELQKSLEPDAQGAAQEPPSLPPAWRNQFWPQAGGYPNHSMQNLELGPAPLKRLWRVSIGRGTQKNLPLTAQPLVVDGQVYTLDTGFRLCAFGAETGTRTWCADVKNPQEDDDVIGGGIAFSGGYLYVTNGYDELLAVRPLDGKILWRARIPAPSRAAPTVMEERAYVTTLDNRLVALSALDGKILWQYEGLSETAGLVGAASAAASRDVVVPVFSSGEITALRAGNGSVAWSDNLSNLKRVGGLASLADIRALPVFDQGLIIAISFSGKMVGIDERTGTRVWQREIGGSHTPWVAGNTVFVLSSENELVALTRESGIILWVMRLPKFEDEKDRSGPIAWTGPVMGGGRLILAGTDGRVLEIDPVAGKIVQQWQAGDTVSIAPVIADRTLYLLSEDGTLSAYR